jgi:hypothetical protein
MATNKPYGDNARKGALRERSQRKTKVMGDDHWTKRSRRSGKFMAQKPTGAKKYKDVRREAQR